VGHTILTRPDRPAPARTALPPARFPWGWLAAASAVRLVALLTLPLLDDEAYYWTWSRHLHWGYLDHPPAVAVLVAAARSLGDDPWALRLPSFLLAAATAWVVFRLTHELYGPSAARRSQWLFHSVPLFVAGGVLISPDAPFVFLWAVATWAAWRVTQGHTQAWWWLGASVGLGLQSKYSMAFLIPSVVALAVRDPSALRRPEPYGAAALAGLLFLPNFVWNFQHGWQAFRFVWERGAWVQAGPVGNLVLSAGGALLYLSPALAVLLLVAPWRGHGAGDRFLRALCLPTLAAAAVAAVGGKLKPHYLAPVALLGVPALAAWEGERAARWRKLAAAAGLVQSAAAVALAASTAWNPAVLADQRGWDLVAREVTRRASQDTVVVTTTYQNAGQLSYALRERYPVAVLAGPHTFDQWSPLARYAGRPALLVQDAGPLPAGLSAWCQDPQRLADLVYPGPDRPLRRFALVRCRALSPPSR